ncbi:protein of unknown function [Xylanibacter ruminicola]|uniref:DUF4369 domain-containing protein n=1 Tax=Xylanibacter ruminicola TaxID=839 RepID=A0A1H5XM41_XYLRU|nr:DUF4369 domain-containing protein [Xylanibacter ruminicola]SEG12480.1 protein of unknown function [Xylanibacter ruminicola]
MKKILLCVMAMAVVTMFYSCKQNSNVCRIQGVVNGEQFEGKRIFLVPFTGPKTAETVDSMEIKDGKFHFETDSMQMYKLLIDLRFRVGIQPLLVIGEPGEVRVVIDSVSHAMGTPQNDSLEKWKVRTEIHNRELGKMHRFIAELQAKGDTVQAKYIQQRADSFHLVYKNYSRKLAENMKEGVLHDFLKTLFPQTYQRKYPDGRVVTMDADTNEEIIE